MHCNSNKIAGVCREYTSHLHILSSSPLLVAAIHPHRPTTAAHVTSMIDQCARVRLRGVGQDTVPEQYPVALATSPQTQPKVLPS